MRASVLPALPLALMLAGCFMPAATGNRMENRFRDARVGEVRAQFQVLREHVAGQGWSVVGEPHIGWLEKTYNENDEPRLTLPASGRHALLAVCDGNCSDIDLVVLDSQRRRLGADLEPDDRPSVEFSGARGDVVIGAGDDPGVPDRPVCVRGDAGGGEVSGEGPRARSPRPGSRAAARPRMQAPPLQMTDPELAIHG